MNRTRLAGALSVALVAALALPACGSSDSSSSESGSGSAALAATTAVASAASGDAAAPATSAVGATGGGATPVPVPPPDRKVIVVVTLDVQVDNVGTANAKVVTLAEGLGGYVQSQQAALAGERPSSTVVLKVPPDKVTALLTSIAGLGKVVNQTQQAEDVTAQYVDLESRIATARTSVQRVREFLNRTSNVNELAGLEAELTRRETELEQLVAAQQGLAARSALATVTIGLVTAPPATTVATTAAPLTPGRALEGGVDALAAIGKALAIVAAFAVPFLPLLGALAIGLAVVRRRTVRREGGGGRPEGPAPEAPAAERERVDA